MPPLKGEVSLSKKVLTSWWTGKQAPPPLPPSPVSAKIKDFSGAEPAGKRFLLWKMGFSGEKIAPCPPYTPLGTIESSNGLRPSRALPSFLTVWPPLKGEVSAARAVGFGFADLDRRYCRPTFVPFVGHHLRVFQWNRASPGAEFGNSNLWFPNSSIEPAVATGCRLSLPGGI